MTDYPKFEFSKRDVKRAGDMIAGDLTWTDDTAPKIREAFTVANNWRDGHAYPMRSIRCSVMYYMRKLEIDGITAARLKRMPAIRRKLRRVKLGLDQLQDLAGCRFILPTIADVHALVSRLKENRRFVIRSENNYIAEPKPDGYRSHHLIYLFKGRKPSMYDGRRIELQVRTRLQHSWATSIEAVGLFRGEELKNHQGSDEWLRLFQLMSAEFAEAEQCALPPETPDKPERQAEIRRLAKSLDAMAVLDSVSIGFGGTDLPLAYGFTPSHYLIKYDHATRTVSVKPYRAAAAATQSYDSAESSNNKTDLNTENVVLVEVDKIANLKAAYPNYFGDVELFKHQLRGITMGKSAVEYAKVPRQPPPRRELGGGDVSWVRRNPFPRPDAIKRKRKPNG